jgi:hypothetical protein
MEQETLRSIMNIGLGVVVGTFGTLLTESIVTQIAWSRNPGRRKEDKILGKNQAIRAMLQKHDTTFNRTMSFLDKVEDK